jgi:RNA polymerase sigma-70 factor (ECF subfamily)
MPSDPEFEKLVDLYYGDLYRFAFSLTRSEAEAADLTQQTFYIWARKGHQLRTLANVKGWLFTTLHREFLQTRRRQERISDKPLSEEIVDEIAVASADAISKIDIRTMLEFFDKIDESYQAPLVLYYVENLSYKEIAEVLEIPLGTVQSRIARGKMHLHQLLTGETRPKRTKTPNE